MAKTATKFIWEPDEATLERANVTRLMRKHGIDDYWELVRRSQEDPEWFWPAAIEDMGLEFSRPWDQVVDLSRGPEWATWFVGGKVNIAWNCVHRWAESQPDAVGAVGLGEDGSRRELTFAELSREVTRLAEALVELGVEEGDRVAIFLPMSPEVAIASHACAHIGAVQVPIFSGFAAPAVAQRLQASEAKVAITTETSKRRGRDVPMLEILEEARKEAPALEHVVVAPWDDLVADQPGELPPAELDSEAPYLLTYTSGTTGTPKGVLHVQGGFLVSIAREVAYQADAGPDDVIHFVTDMGWIMGPWTVVGGHAMGSTLVFAEGAPDWPQDRLWQLIEQEGVTILGISPTLTRALIPHGEPRADLSSLRVLVTTGEPWNPGPYQWLFEEVGGGRCPIINCSGGTEVGACFLSPTPVVPIKACSLGGPALGMAMDVVDARGQLDSRRGRRARLPQAVPRHDPRLLARPGALPRHVLAPLPRDLDARRLGLRRRGRLLVPARPLRRHAEHRRQADRPGRDRVGRGRAPGGVRGGRGRHPARGQGRGGVGVLRARAGSRAERRARRGDQGGRRGRARQGVPARPRALRQRLAEDAKRQDRAARGAGEGARDRPGRPVVTREPRDPGGDCQCRLSHVTALVTGGGRGIGAGIARALAEDGWSVVVGARSRDQVEEVAQEIGGRAVELDVADRESVERAVAEAGEIDLLVANAGIGGQGQPTWEAEPEDWWRVLEVNVLGVHLSCRAVIPGMLERGRGRIVITGQRRRLPAGNEPHGLPGEQGGRV